MNTNTTKIDTSTVTIFIFFSPAKTNFPFFEIPVTELSEEEIDILFKLNGTVIGSDSPDDIDYDILSNLEARLVDYEIHGYNENHVIVWPSPFIMKDTTLFGWGYFINDDSDSDSGTSRRSTRSADNTFYRTASIKDDILGC
jgi:hypothetical protein